MDDAQPLAHIRVVHHIRQLRVARQQRMDQRAALVARSRMNDHAGRLVDHRQVVVFVDDFQRDVFRLNRSLRARRDAQP